MTSSHARFNLGSFSVEILLQLLTFSILNSRLHLGRLSFIQINYSRLLRLVRALPQRLIGKQDATDTIMGKP